MSKVMNVWPQPFRKTGSLFEVEAIIECERLGRDILWYRMPESQDGLISHSADAFAIAVIFSAMRNADKLHIHGQVSPSLMGNMMEFQRAWSRWCPERYRVIDLQADIEAEEEEEPSGDVRSIMAFSGGLDSCFTAWKHTNGETDRLRHIIGAGLMVHGFDIPLSSHDEFTRASENSRNLLNSIGLQSLYLSTNFRSLGDDWEEAHGAAIISALHLFKRAFKSGVIASSHSYDALRFPWGSNPVTDSLLSSDGFNISHDGCGFLRREKAGSVAKWPEAMKRLRICWEGPEKDKNCGVCLRCVATAICFEIEGAPLPTSLPVPDIPAALDHLATRNLPPVAIIRLSELLSDAEKSGLTLPWIDSLRRLIVSRERRVSMLKISRFTKSLKRLIDGN